MKEPDFDITKIKKVPIEEIRPNTWNPKEKDTPEYKKIVKGIQYIGLKGAIVVRQNKGYEIIDGNQRYNAALELGFKEMYVYDEGEIGDKEAKELTIWYQQQVPFEKVAEAYFVNDLVMEYKGEVQLPYSTIELAEMQQIATFDFNQYGKGEPPDEDLEARTFKVVLTLEQYEIVMKAIGHIMTANDSNEARALELMSADYLSGVQSE